MLIMNNLLLGLSLLAEETGTDTGTDTSSSTDKMMDALKGIVTSPIFYIVLGALVVLIIVVYLIRRVVKPASNQVKVIVSGGKIVKLLDENSDKHFLVPFKESVGAIVTLSEKELSSDKLYINNGPDALYQINYTLGYKVSDVATYYNNADTFSTVIITKINDKLREYADEGHALDIVKDYRSNTSKLLELINSLTSSYGVEATSLKINYISPMGK